ncbi:MAG: hypothetical protein SFX72_12150 [Isosphaeraceae bacterium]|nr:hypothetical protein [Isosphaeraceae bacterium]
MDAHGRPLDPEDVLKRPRGRIGKDLVLRLLDRLVQVLERGHEVGHGQVEQVVEQMIRSVTEPILGVALDVPPMEVEEGKRLRVVTHEIIRSKKEIQLMEPGIIGLGIEVDR